VPSMRVKLLARLLRGTIAKSLPQERPQCQHISARAVHLVHVSLSTSGRDIARGHEVHEPELVRSWS